MTLRRATAVPVVALVCAAPVAAQQPQPRRTAAWASLGVGSGFLQHGGDLAAHLEGAYQFGSNLVALRFGSAAALVSAIINAITGEPGETAAHDVGLLFGRATPPAAFHAAAAAGVGIASLDRDSAGTRVTAHRFTVPLEVQLAWRPARYVGLGLCGFVSINNHTTFGGLTVGIQLGRLR